MAARARSPRTSGGGDNIDRSSHWSNLVRWNEAEICYPKDFFIKRSDGRVNGFKMQSIGKQPQLQKSDILF